MIFSPPLSFRILTLAAVYLLDLRTGLCGERDTPALRDQVVNAVTEKKVDLRLRRLTEIGMHVSPAGMSEALALSETLKELRERAVFREGLIKHWSEEKPAEAWSYVRTLPEGRGKLDLLRIVITAYANKDPAHAAAAVGDMSEGRSKIEAVAMVAEGWAKAEMTAALPWVRSLPAGPAKDAALYSLRFIWVHSDPAAAAEDIVQMEAGDVRKTLLINIAGEWASRDPDKAIGWAQSLRNPSEQEEALFNIAESWADTQPRQAAEFIGQLPPPLRQRAAVAVVGRWATQEPKEALTWAAETDDSVIQSRGFVEGLNVWTAVDPNAAELWVKRLKAGNLRDSAIQAYIDTTLEWAPAAAAQLGLQISDLTLRLQQVERGLAHWLEVDPSSARAWLELVDLPVETKREWLSRSFNR